MPTLLKIFIALFLQLGVGDPKEMAGSVNWDEVLIGKNMVLNVETTDPVVLDRIISICQANHMNTVIENTEKSETVAKASLSFKNMAFTTRSRLMEQLKNVGGNVNFQWNN